MARVDLMVGQAYAHSGQTEKASESFRKALDHDDSPAMRNRIASELAEDNVALDLALRYAEEAVKADEDDSSTISTSLDDLEPRDFGRMQSLAAEWDTLGRVHFRLGHFPEAEKYLKAAWVFSQGAVMAEHLGELYEKTGNGYEAAHFYALSIAVSSISELPRRRLVHILGTDARADFAIKTARGELSSMQTLKVARPAPGVHSADFYLLFNQTGRLQSVKFIKGDSQLRNASNSISKARFKFVFPDDRPTQLVQRAVLLCVTDASTCDLLLINSPAVRPAE
jgi:tetratricopeptide (TPR) repeat protein